MRPRLIRHTLAVATLLPTALAAQWTPDSATRYLDSVHAVIRRTHWDTATVGAPFTARWQEERAALAGGTPSLDDTRAAAARLLRSLQQSHFGIIPAPPAASPERGVEGDHIVPITLRLIRDTLRVVRLDAPLRDVAVGDIVGAIDDEPVAPRVRQLAGFEPRERALRVMHWAEARLTGEEGTRVLLRVQAPGGAVRTVPLVRSRHRGDALQMAGFGMVPALVTHRIITHRGRRVGVIGFNAWLPQLLPAIDSIVDRFRTLDALVLDVRGNPGGIAVMANGLAGHLLPDTATLARMTTRAGTLTYRANPRLVSRSGVRVTPFSGPVAVLVDAASASTSELFAGGLQAIGRARIVGDTTAGLALPSLTVRLPAGDVLQYAVASLVTRAGTPLEGRGVIPDQVVGWPLTAGADDRQLRLALDLLIPRSRVGPAPVRRR